MLISIVGPVYNEADGIEEFYRQLREVCQRLPYAFEFLFVNDGSTDKTVVILDRLKCEDARVKIIHLSRNFGHQIAIKAGLDHAKGEAVILMDTDLQDPPDVIPDFISKWQEGYDVVYAVRATREGESLFKKLTASFYYRLIKK